MIVLNGCAQPSSKHAQKSKSIILPTDAQTRLDGLKAREKSKTQSLTAEIPVRCVGPTVMSGRVVDLDVDPTDPTHFFVAYASGGLWVTYNNGVSFSPIFDHESVMTIGDFTVDWKNNETIWLGTGEVNSSRSSYSGVGIFKGIKTKNEAGNFVWNWSHSGLTNTQHIGKVILHPSNSNILWVASLGHLYSENNEGGVFKTEDGGKTWKQTLKTSSLAGVVDLVIDPTNPNELFAAVWERSRKAWNFTGNGSGSSVFQSTDGGNNWGNIASNKDGGNVINSGFNNTPSEWIGRIGLALHHSSKGKFLYAMVDNQQHRPDSEKKEESDEWKKDKFQNMSKEEFVLLNDTLLNDFLRNNGFEEEYTSESIKAKVKKDEIKPSALYDFLYDANEDLFDTPVVGAEVYSYDFNAKKWTRTHEDYLDDVVFSYGYYFGLIRVSELDPQKIYIAGVPLLRSDDGGKNWKGINPDNVHVDHHALWLNPNRAGHLINGSDGGVQISYDDGRTFVNCNSPAVGQFYAVQVDNATPYNVYGGLQDNGVWYASSESKMSEEWRITGDNEFDEILGGDGMQIMVDNRDNSTVYTGFQFGNYSRVNAITGDHKSLSVTHKLGERPLRWNWQTPILLSKFNQDILYICSNKVHRSTDKGEHFETLSEDLTKGEKKGNVPYGTITSIAESPLQFGLLVVGSDDGLVHISNDNGYSWLNISSGLPENLWVSRVVFSAHSKSRIYVSMNGYRQDHFQPYVFVSDDFGKTWKNISSSLPMEPVNVIREDNTDEDILYVGTDHGLYISLNRGASWSVMSSALPEVAVHDIVIQEREQDLIIGTHGRSIWIADLEEIRQLNKAIRSQAEVELLDVKKIVKNGEWGGNWSKWLEPVVPECHFAVYSSTAMPEASVEILWDSLVLKSFPLTNLNPGLHLVHSVLTMDADVVHPLEDAMNGGEPTAGEKKTTIKKADDGNYYLPKGSFKVKLIAKGKEVTKDLVIE